MKLEYKQNNQGNWECSLGCKVIAKITIDSKTNNWSLEDGENQVRAFDCTTSEPTKIPGSPFPTLNQAKAVIEYHFRNLLES